METLSFYLIFWSKKLIWRVAFTSSSVKSCPIFKISFSTESLWKSSKSGSGKNRVIHLKVWTQSGIRTLKKPGLNSITMRNLSNVCFAVLNCSLCFLKHFMMMRNLSNVCFAVFFHHKTPVKCMFCGSVLIWGRWKNL